MDREITGKMIWRERTERTSLTNILVQKYDGLFLSVSDPFI